MAARRVTLPTADDLFRPTSPAGKDPSAPQPVAKAEPPAPVEAVPEQPGRGRAKPSGRVRHDEKMTVYITSEELLEIEHARLALRRAHGVAVDRGRLVRAAVAIALADLEAHGDECALVRRLTEE